MEYSKDNVKWKRINRNKFLFNGYYVRAGNNGSCKLLNQKTNTVRTLSSNSSVVINSEGASLVTGKLSDSTPAGTLTGGLKKKFSTIHKYTTVVRSSPSPKRIRLYTPNNFVLSEMYPYLVWENVSEAFMYRLVIGNKVIDIPGSHRDYVRYKVTQLPPGEHKFKIQVINSDGQVVYTTRENSTIRFMSAQENTTLEKKVNSIIDNFGNGIILGNFLDEQGFKVAAMDNYHNFLNESPYNTEMMPFLIKIYEDLKLNKLRCSLTTVYNNYNNYISK